MAEESGAMAAEQIETIHVSVDDIVSVEKRNARDAESRTNHCLRVSPPFDADVRASIHTTQEGNHYPPDMSVVPIHLEANDFHDGEFDFPEAWEVHDAAMEVDDVDELEDVSEETLEECWNVQVEIWESELRNELRDELTIEDGTGSEIATVDLEFDE